ncbi:acetolactate synthase-1/2/3 large subunit [Nocardia transvalensis]|uniref:acetolactate synthase n=1 Tax=Nocardia transvalensis TaxID=37333 RepID=A0A7W9PD57_9NOCA|nr:thiamine pyrophosphate-binding protein [Nocardia transvalensis]MBB5913991.1 acetolactate synthase-1/2/3 large subunit [Nocardia transvalensis]
MPSRAVDYLVQAVATLGVRQIFGVDGANIEDLYDAVFDSPHEVTGVVAKHEFSAATMADGYARSSGGLGVVCATSGGGAMNLVAGLAESFASRVPVLALVGQPPTALEGRGAFQDTSGLAGTFDAERLFEQITRYCARVDAVEALPWHLARAVTAARRGGPAVLLLPKDVQQADASALPPFRPPRRTATRDDAGLNRVRAVLSAARATGKITIIAGDQVARDDARGELRRLAQVLDAAVGVAPDAEDVYDRDESGFCGVAGSMGHPELIDAVRGSALCLLVGTRMPVTARAGLDDVLAGTALASVAAEPPYLDSIHAAADLKTALAELAAGLVTDEVAAVSARGGHSAAHDRPAPAAASSHHNASPGDTAPGHGGHRERAGRGVSVPSGEPPTLTPLQVPDATGPGLRYREIVETLNAALEPGTDVFADAGNTGAAVVHHLRLPRGGRFVVALGMGGMGYAFGAGIGSAFARHRRPGGGERRTVVVAGDGAFFMHGMEIHTAIEHRLPVTFVVCNNNGHAMCITREQLYYGDRYSFNRFRPAHLGAGMAAMFPDLPSYSPADAGELAAVLRCCFDTPGPSFVSIDCDPDEIPPFTPFLSIPRRNP